MLKNHTTLRVIFTLFISLFLSLNALALSKITPEKALIIALKKEKNTEVRNDPALALSTYKTHRIIPKRPNAEVDYSDYYFVKKPAKFLGHKLVIIKHEYSKTYRGCCVNPGLELILKPLFNTKNIHAFAKKHTCIIKENVNIKYDLEYMKIAKHMKFDGYITLSCKENTY